MGDNGYDDEGSHLEPMGERAGEEAKMDALVLHTDQLGGAVRMDEPTLHERLVSLYHRCGDDDEDDVIDAMAEIQRLRAKVVELERAIAERDAAISAL